MTEQSLPRGWDPERVRRVLAHYDSQTEEEAFTEDESAMAGSSHTVVEVPEELMSAPSASSDEEELDESDDFNADAEVGADDSYLEEEEVNQESTPDGQSSEMSEIGETDASEGDPPATDQTQEVEKASVETEEE